MAQTYSILRVPADGAMGPDGGLEMSLFTAELQPADIRSLRKDRNVRAIAPEMPTRLIEAHAGNGADARAGTAWGIVAVGADRSPFTGDAVSVAVLDTGIDTTHAAFAGIDLVEKDFTREGNGDPHGHGTHCAGTIFGRDVDGTRIGVARGVSRALVGKVLAATGNGTSTALFDAIYWALEGGADVISMSLGFDFPGMAARAVADGARPDVATSMALEAYRANLRMFDALMGVIRARAAFSGGAVVVAASGNESDRPNFVLAASIPAAAQDVMSVGALRKLPGGFAVAPFSNTLPVLSAPGVDVMSAKAGGGLTSFSGTSMATPHVAGVAALWWEASRKRGTRQSAKDVEHQLIAMARDNVFVAGTEMGDVGAGLVTAPSPK